jgi:large subunit ribosomal protein L3
VAGVIGKKVGMTQLYNEQDTLVPVTVIQAGPCPVVQVREDGRDGYRAVRVGFGDVKPERLTKPDAGVFAKAGIGPKRVLREFRLAAEETYQVGDTIDEGIFQAGDLVDVTGTSKGKGFAGVVRRHHFRGGPRSHGQSDRHRAPGSVGSSSYPSRVFKGLRMAGRMGNRRVTTRGLSVVRVDKERNLLFVEGAVPGARGGLLLIRKAG